MQPSMVYRASRSAVKFPDGGISREITVLVVKIKEKESKNHDHVPQKL